MGRDRAHGRGRTVGTIGLAVVAVGCTGILGIESLPRGEGAATSGSPFVYADDQCRECVAARCAVAELACAGAAPCDALYACLAKCRTGDPECRGACEEARTVAAAEPSYHAIDGCRRSACTDECYGTRGIVVAATASEACTDCIQRACASELHDCVASGKDAEGATIGDCERSFRCILRPTLVDPDNSLACFYGHPDADEEGNALRHCVERSVCDDCGFGRDYACVGRFRWRGPEVSSRTFLHHLTFVDYATDGPPAVPLHVRACDPTQCAAPVPCESSGAPVVLTDEAGAVDVPLRQTETSGFTGCFYVTGEGYVPLVFQYDRPIVRREGHLRIDVASEDTLRLVADLTHVNPDPARALVAVLTSACDAYYSPGVALSVSGDGATIALYARGRELTRDPPTDTSGQVVFVNVPVRDGYTDLVSSVVADGRAVAHMRLRVVPGTMTAVWLFPDAKETP